MTYNEIRNYLLNNTQDLDIEEDIDGSVEIVIVDNMRKCYLFAAFDLMNNQKLHVLQT